MKMAHIAAAAALVSALAGAPGAAWAEGEAYTLSYDGGEATLSSDDLLGHVGPMWPGGSYGGVLVLSNGSMAPAQATLFMVGAETGAANRGEAAELLERCWLTISCQGSTAYDGPLSGSAMDGPAPLCSLEPGGSAELAYEVSLPPGLGNEFALLVHEAAWGIEVTELPDSAGSSSNRKPLAQTGDGALLALAAIPAALAGGALAASRRRNGGRA